MKYIIKIAFKEIKNTLWRYIAISMIITLGVGVFSGLMITKVSMVEMANDFVSDNNLYDYKLMSKGGLKKNELDLLRNIESIKDIEGSYTTDRIAEFDTEEITLRIHSTEIKINKFVIEKGRMPEKANECVADKKYFTEKDIGKKLKILTENSKNSLVNIENEIFTIVGIGISPLYMNFERGITNIGDGSIDGFILIPEENFDSGIYSEAYLTLKDTKYIYSKEYDDLVTNSKEEIEKSLGDIMAKRNPYYSSFIFTRSNNIGYVCFESDSNIMEDVVKVFPIFFFFVAALVCMTTMTHMVNEQRTEIGVLKAMGYGKMAIATKYIFYSGSSTLIGVIIGFFGGSYLFPKIIWMSFTEVYGFSQINPVFDWRFALISLIVSFVCTIGVTWISCSKELMSHTAQLIRPKVPATGKRIFLERVSFIWKRMSFLYKISIRNLCRYKQRFIMMIIGIGGATAILLTGLGMNDSTQGIVSKQYDDVTRFDYQINFAGTLDDEKAEAFYNNYENEIISYLPVNLMSTEIIVSGLKKNIDVVAIDDYDVDKSNFIGLENNGKKVIFPDENEAVISINIAQKFNVLIGDTIVLRDTDMNEAELRISGIFDNYINNYVFLTAETYENKFNRESNNNVMYANVKDNLDYTEIAKKFLTEESVTNVNIMEDFRIRFKKIMSNLQYIVLVIILCSGILTFIIIYNLTNINISERKREISTVKVLGFYPDETSAYVFRENIILTIFGIILGLFGGGWLHAFVMSQINFDKLYFATKISTVSYLLTFSLIMMFTLLISRVIRYKVNKIEILDALKTVE